MALADALGIVSHTRVVALRHSAHKEIDLSGTRGRDNLLARRLGTAIGDVLGNGAIEQPGVLQHHAKLLAQLAAVHAARVHTVKGNAATVDLVEAHEQIDERGLARARGSHHRDLLARLGGKRHVAHERLVGRIAKTHVFKGNTALHLARQLGCGRRQRIGFHLGLVEQVEHALGARQRALQRVKGKRQLRHGLGRLVDKLEERLEHADGHVTGNQHAAAHKRNNDLRQTADKAHRGADSIDHKVGLGAHTSQFLRSLVHLSGALTFAVKRADHQTARIAFLDRTRNLGHPLLALTRHIVCAARDDLRHQQRQCRKEQKD